MARWQELKARYPKAFYSADETWFYGALRETDQTMRALDLGRLIDKLTARENGP